MAGQDIDKLLLEIEVRDNTSGGSEKKIEALATAVSHLSKEIASIDISKFDKISNASASLGKVSDNLSNMSQSLKIETMEIKKSNNTLSGLSKQRKRILSSFGFSEEAYKSLSPEAIKAMNEQLPDLKRINEEMAKIQTSLPTAQGDVGEKIDDVIVKTKTLSKEQAKIANEVEKTEKSQEKVNKKTSGFGKLLKSIGRVAVYRLIRAALKAITQAFKEGFTNLAQFSSEVNNQLSKLQSSTTIIKNSIGLIFLPLLQAITPIVQYVAQGIAGLANAFSYLIAKLQGSATYLKINTEYFKKFNEQANLLSFDTFEKLGTTDNVSDMFEEMSTAGGINLSEELNGISLAIGAITTGLVTLGGLKIIQLLTSGALTAGISAVWGALTTTAGTITILAAGVALLAAGIADMALNWDNANIESWEKQIIIITAAAAALATAFIAVAMAIQGVKGIGAVVGLGAAITGAILLAGTEIAKITEPKKFANGGSFNSADMFYANENGRTELVASNNSGGGAVMTQEQWGAISEASFYNALIRFSRTNSNGESAIYLDGNRVGTFIAGNTGFRNEANRRNTTLNWR